MNRTSLALLLAAVALGAGFGGYFLGQPRNVQGPREPLATATPAPAPTTAPVAKPTTTAVPTPAAPTKPTQTGDAAPKPLARPAPAPAAAGTTPFTFVRLSLTTDRGEPEACLHFSRELDGSGKVKYADFVEIEPATKAAFTVTRERLCIGGLAYGTDYDVKLRAGLPAADGAKLPGDQPVDVAFGERPPVVAFQRNGHILPRQTSAGVPLTTVNVSKVQVQVYRVGERLLPRLGKAAARHDSDEEGEDRKSMDVWALENFRNNQAALVWSGTMEVKNVQNTATTTTIPVREVIGAWKPGAYVILAWNAADGDIDTLLGDSDRRSEVKIATQWVLDSDIALTTFAGADGMVVFARSLDSAKPVAGIEIALVARNNEELGRLTTDAAGKVVFAAGIANGKAALEPVSLMAFDRARSDFAHLDLGKAAFDFSDRGVEGRATPGPVDGFLYTERGVCRPGETVNVTALIRDRNGDALDKLPVTLVVKRPDGVEVRRATLQLAANGALHLPVELTRSARRGKWTVTAQIDPRAPPVGQVEFGVEDFIPQKIKVELETAQQVLGATSRIDIGIRSDFLYGAPAAGLDGEGEIVLRADPNPFPREPGFRFGDVDENPARDSLKLTVATLDERGRGKATGELAVKTRPSMPLAGDVRVSIFEPGGRATSEQITLPVRLRDRYFGIRPLFEGGSTTENAPAGFEVIALDGDAKRVSEPSVEWRLMRETTRFQWYREDGNWRWRQYTSDSAVARGTLDLRAEKPAELRIPVGWGTYRLIVTDGDNASSVRFSAGWGAVESKRETPDMATVAADKPAYAPGDVAKLRIDASFDGRALVVIANDRVLETREVDVAAGGSTIDVAVGDNWGAGAYALVTAYRPLSNRAERAPTRAVGIAWLAADTKPRALQVTIGTPERVRPRAAMVAPVRVANAGGGEVFVTLAAIDEGILQLTKFRTPDPLNHYFGKRMLGVAMRDDYGKLLDASADYLGQLRSGGDAGGGAGLEVVPIRIASLFSGIVRLDASGEARITLDIPDFSGQLRLMAVAFDAKRVGSAETKMFVRDAVATDLVLPRFLAPGDASQATISLHNVEGVAGDYVARLDAKGTVGPTGATTKTVTLAAGKREQFALPIAATDAGLASVTLTVEGPGAFKVVRSWDIEVRPAQAPITRQTTMSLAPGAEQRLDRGVLADFLRGSTTVTLAISGTRTIDVPSLLQSLDKYPFGCLEQTTSRALPLLYFNDAALLGGVKEDKAIARRVQDAVHAILDRQASDGGFGMWNAGGDPADQWLQVYAIDFLMRAREKQYVVQESQYRRALQWLQRNAERMAPNPQAYALMILGNAGLADPGRVRYFQDTQAANLTGALSRGHLAVALHLVGERGRFEPAFRAAMEKIGEVPKHDYYGTALRDVAALLPLAVAHGGPDAVRQLSSVLARGGIDDVKRTTTQERAWLLLAAVSQLRSGDKPVLEINGQGVAAVENTVAAALQTADLEKAYVVRNAGKSDVWTTVSVRGVPTQTLPAENRGLEIRRQFRTMEGDPVDLSKLRQNDRVLVTLYVSAPAGRYHEIALLDLLPAGLEIEGVLTEKQKWMGRLDTPSTAEARDDRFFAAFEFGKRDWPEGWRPWFGEGDDKRRDMHVAYIARAVTPGTYTLPAAQAEDMYAPDVYARTAPGRITILPR